MSTDYRIVLTPVGYAKINKELEQLRTVNRHAVADRIRDAKQFGEFTENAEYEEAKKEQAMIEGRIQELRSVLQIAQILQEEDIPTDHVGVGSIVNVLDMEAGDEWEFTIVGSFETDPDNDRISDVSPVGEALLGRKVGEEVDVTIPDGQTHYRIISIRK
jgi:transcription elongation factor GreA